MGARGKKKGNCSDLDEAPAWSTPPTAEKLITLAACLFYSGWSKAADTGCSVTFARDIAPIFQEKCEERHHQGTAALMSLSTYKEARLRAKSIRERVITWNMPPWHIDKRVGIQCFQN